MRVRFYIEKRRDEDGKLQIKGRPIFMTVAFQGKRVILSTGKKVDLIWWDHEKQLVKETYSDASEINRWLIVLAHTAGVTWKALVSLSENPGVREFRETFEELKPRYSGGFFDVMYLFLNDGSEHWSKATYKKVRTFYKQIKEFEKNEQYILGFNSINDEFLIRFTKYQQVQGKSEMTIYKMINTLVWFLNWASDKGYNVYYDYRRFYKKLKKESALNFHEVIYLEWDELIQLMNHPVKEVRGERVRDLFCIMCFSGIRFSELSKLRKGDITEISLFIRGNGRKSRQIPMNKYTEQLIKKYEHRYYRNNMALPVVSAVTMNKYLKSLGVDIGFSRLVPNPENPVQKIRLSEALTAGVAVQTFIMNAIRLDIPVEVISSYTGVNNDQRIQLLKHEIEKKEIKKFNTILPQ